MRTNKKMNKIVGSKFVTIWYLFIAILIILSMIPNMAATSYSPGNMRILVPECPEKLAPIAIAFSEYQEAYVGEKIKFDGSRSYDLDGYIVSYEWDFGDGMWDCGESVEHFFLAPGNYNVILIVTDNDCLIDIDIWIIIIIDPGTPPPCENQPPISLPLPSYQEIYIDELALFDGSMSYDMDGYIVSYEWHFGDNSTGYGMWVDHIYDSPGEYSVILTVTDDDGATGSNCCYVLVKDDNNPPPCENEPPVAIAEPKYQEVLVGENATFNGSRSYDSDGYIVSFEWDFGDGSNGSVMSMSHIYNEPGEYVVTLTVTDDDGAASSDFCFIWVICEHPPPPPSVNLPPVPVPNPRYQEVFVGENASFEGYWSYDPDGYIVSYEWDFGDNSSAWGIFVTHAYDYPGLYYVMLTVTDDDNATSYDFCVVMVWECKPPPSENHPPIAIADPKYQEVLLEENATFDGSFSYDPDGYIVSYEWDFGDGTFGFGPAVSHSYDVTGVYLVSLTVTDNENATAIEYCTVFVGENYPPPPPENCPPIAFAQPKCQVIKLNETAIFDGSESYDLDGTIVSYEWNFGDGSFGFGQIATHQYEKEGEYRVILTVTDDDNASARDMCFVFVCESEQPEPGLNLPPIALGTPQTQEIYVGEYAKVNGLDSYDPDGYIVSFEWDYGEGAIYNGVYAASKLCTPGTYDITLTVRDNEGATASDTISVTVLERNYDSPKRPDKNLPDDVEVPIPDINDSEEILLILSAGLINVATFKEGWERIVSVEVAAYHGYAKSVSIELIDDGGLKIEVIPIVRDVPKGRIVKFYLKIKVPEFEDDTQAQGITIQLKAVGENCESNIEYVDILISSKESQEDPEISNAAQTVGTLSGVTILGLLLKRRFL